MLKSNSQKQKPKRIKERYVGDVIDLVSLWRQQFETKFRDENGKIVKLSLDQAAEIVAVPRKTLEDYYYQIKRAEKILKVNINDKRHEKMGYLRRLIKESRQNSNLDQEQQDTDRFFIMNEEEQKCNDSFDMAIHNNDNNQNEDFIIIDKQVTLSQMLGDQDFMQGQYWRHQVFENNKQINDELVMEMEMEMEDMNPNQFQKQEE